MTSIVKPRPIGWRGWTRCPPAPELPLLHSTKLTQPQFTRRDGQLPAAQWQRLKQRIAQAKLTPSGVLAAAFAEVLAQWSKRRTLPSI